MLAQSPHPPGAGRQRWAAVAVTPPPGAAADAARCRVRPSRWSSDDSDKRLRAAAAPPSPPPSPARRHPSAPRVRHRPRSPPESDGRPVRRPSRSFRCHRPPPFAGPVRRRRVGRRRPSVHGPPPAPGPSAAGPPPAPSSTSPSVAPVRPLIPSVAHLCRPVRRLPHPPSWPPPTTANLVHHACDACTRHCGTPAGASK